MRAGSRGHCAPAGLEQQRIAVLRVRSGKSGEGDIPSSWDFKPKGLPLFLGNLLLLVSASILPEIPLTGAQGGQTPCLRLNGLPGAPSAVQSRHRSGQVGALIRTCFPG
ncbi:hypothetical protein JRQ81_017691 [Phrynocephalus forsythii]|uniref:Uncharacterized protein n=1 Tax=Phrynocephalus forsythii TaxID=171643 RepID=A0A9Q1B0F1_9SAUR|nr:hypothetical protein JRQ81_017691 [Phrynocephalus forsythii]